MRRGYAIAAAGSLMAVALWRHDLTRQAWLAASHQLAAGPAARLKVLAEALLLALILCAAVYIVARRPRPARDARILLIAGAVGWVMEAWGTRLGTCVYFTGEQPPHWIALAWALGALVLDRLGETAERTFGRAPVSAYWAGALYCGALSLWFFTPWLGRVSGWLGPAAVLMGLLWSAEPAADFWRLAAGLVSVFFADLWGTTNGCWIYAPSIQAHGPWAGVAFGMAFDTALALGCLRLARRLE